MSFPGHHGRDPTSAPMFSGPIDGSLLVPDCAMPFKSGRSVDQAGSEPRSGTAPTTGADTSDVERRLRPASRDPPDGGQLWTGHGPGDGRFRTPTVTSPSATAWITATATLTT